MIDLALVGADPVAGRTLAALGADVLRIDPPGLPEIPAQHLDTGSASAPDDGHDGPGRPAAHRVRFGDLAPIAPPGSLDSVPLSWGPRSAALRGDQLAWTERA